MISKGKDVVSYELPFEPFPLLSDPSHQTILGCVLKFHSIRPDPISETKVINLPDGDKVTVEITTPKDWKPTDLTVIMVHGLCGSHKSTYMIRMTQRLEPQRIRVIRFNMRYCGTAKGLSRNIYHAGRSEDLFEALKVLKEANPESPFLLIGFSLGGNQVLKLVGELGTLANRYLEGVIAVCPPTDLFSSVHMLSRKMFYDRYFCSLLRDNIDHFYQTHKDLPRIDLPKDLRLYEFDQVFTAPMGGFENALDYYEKCSSAQFVEDIAIPCRILLSKDDPIICHSSLDHHEFPSHVELFKTNYGGHMGYLGNVFRKRGFFWLDALLDEWIKEF